MTEKYLRDYFASLRLLAINNNYSINKVEFNENLSLLRKINDSKKEPVKKEKIKKIKPILTEKERKDKINKNQREYNKKRYDNDILFRLTSNIRSLIGISLKQKNYTKKSHTYEILGISYKDFLVYLESKFEPWMTWDNRGLYNGSLNYGWDIDHIIPLCSANSEEELLKLNHYTNLQPLCSKINRVIKRDNIIWI